MPVRAPLKARAIYKALHATDDENMLPGRPERMSAPRLKIGARL